MATTVGCLIKQHDNTVLVEALRRRCRLIICIDGGGDSPPLSAGLADAIRLAEFELGVTVTLRQDSADSSPVAPGSGALPADSALKTLKNRLTRRTVAVADIKYPSAAGPACKKGVLVYGKAVLSKTAQNGC